MIDVQHEDMRTVAPKRKRFSAGLKATLSALVTLATLMGVHQAGLLPESLLAPEKSLQTALLPAPSTAASPYGPEIPTGLEAALASESEPAQEATPSFPVPVEPSTAGLEAHFYQEGIASYYGAELAGRPTASGERFDPAGYTAAHRTLPLGTRIRVTNLRNDKTVVVVVNDRGPFAGNRVLDLSHGAARKIGMARAGTGRVSIEVLGRDDLQPALAEPDTTETPSPPDTTVEAVATRDSLR